MFVQGGPGGESGAGKAVGVVERGDVGVQGGEGVLVSAGVVEDEAVGFDGVVGGSGFGVFAEPGGSVEDSAEGELFGVWPEGRGGEGIDDAVVEGVEGCVVLEVGGNVHVFKVVAEMVVRSTPPPSGTLGVAGPP